MTRGRLCLTALPEPGSTLPSSFPDFIPAQPGFSTASLSISCFLWAPATPTEQTQPRGRTRLPAARLGITPEISPLKSGKQRAQQGCAGIWERCWVPVEGSGCCISYLRRWEGSRRGRSIPWLREALPTCAEVRRSPGSPSWCHLDEPCPATTSCSQEYPLPGMSSPRNVPLCGSSWGIREVPPSPAWTDPSGVAANLSHSSSVPLDASLAHREGLWSHSMAPGSHPAFPGRADPSRLLSIPSSATAASSKPSTSCWTGTELGKGESKS